MQIKINEKVLSIPPYISTTWSRISALHMKGSELAISLQSGNIVTIPNLSLETLEAIFAYHATYLEDNQPQADQRSPQPAKSSDLNQLLQHADSSYQFMLGSQEGGGYAMQHNPAQANAPDLPAELLNKIGSVAKILLPDSAVLPQAEPSCNCFHCQIIRAMHADAEPSIPSEEASEVADSDLQFQQWNILQTGEQLFSVTNRLDETEKYHVFLGQPIGCTCGKEGCEHIVAVLKS